MREKRNCGNQVAEIVGEKEKKLMGIVVAELPKLEKRGERKIDLWQ